MIIQCPNCKTELEITESMIGQNVRCSICNTKFNLALKSTIVDNQTLAQENKGKTKSKISFQDPQVRQEIDSLIHSNDLCKYFKLFRLAPKSIKFIALYNVSWFILVFFLSIAANEKPGGAFVLSVILLFPLLRRRNWSWRCYIGLYYFVIFITIVCILSLFFTNGNLARKYLSDCLLSLIIDTPVFIALWRQTARQWTSDDW